MSAYAEGKKAFGFCDRCGFRYKLKELKAETVNLASTNLLVCPECWDPDQPQNMLGRLRVDDPQALRNPRPLGGISGRDLPAAYRWTFESATILDSPRRVNGWSTNSNADTPDGTVPSWDSDEGMMTWNPEPAGAGGAWLQAGYNRGQNEPLNADSELLGIDTSIYKYVTAIIRVNKFPTKNPGAAPAGSGPPYNWLGRFFWSPDTTITNGLPLTHVSIDSSQNATFTYTGDANISVGNRYAFKGLTGEYISGNADTSLSDLNGFNSKGNVAPQVDGAFDGFRDRLMVTGSDPSSKTFTVQNSLIVGDGVTRALSGSPYANCPYPWTAGVQAYSLPQKYDASKFLNSQPSGGFLPSQKSMGDMFKIVWDLRDHEYWTGTVNAIRIDTFDTAEADPDFDVDFLSIQVVAFHNPDL